MPVTGRIVAVCLSARRGETKTPCPEGGLLVENSGLEGDGHAGPGERQVSLLCMSSIEKIRPVVQAAGRDLAPGDFAENLTIDGFDFEAMPLGARLRFANGAELEISKIGKECHKGCAIREIVGDCVMPREGVFARVVRGGAVVPGNAFEVTTP
jgi:MOSC domain-containing protein YiiM